MICGVARLRPPDRGRRICPVVRRDLCKASAYPAFCPVIPHVLQARTGHSNNRSGRSSHVNAKAAGLFRNAAFLGCPKIAAAPFRHAIS